MVGGPGYDAGIAQPHPDGLAEPEVAPAGEVVTEASLDIASAAVAPSSRAAYIVVAAMTCVTRSRPSTRRSRSATSLEGCHRRQRFGEGPAGLTGHLCPGGLHRVSSTRIARDAPPCSGVSVQREDAPLVAAVVAAGVGDVRVPGAAEGADDEVADRRVGIGLVPGADPLQVFAESLVPHVVPAVFDGPVVTGVGA